jgi:hypothetical protein
MNNSTGDPTVVVRHTKWGTSVSVFLIMAGILTALGWIWSVGADSRAAARCRDNLKNIGLALRLYHEHHGSFPPAYVVDPKGRRFHRWRVLILPELGRQELYARYRFDEPWDGPHNHLLISEMPPVFGCPADRSRPHGQTNYVAVVGPTTIWPHEHSASLRDVTDGASNTLHVVENHDLHIAWSEPRDLPFDEVKRLVDANRLPGISSPHEAIAHALLADGQVRKINTNINGDIFKKFCTIAAGLALIGDCLSSLLRSRWSRCSRRKVSSTPLLRRYRKHR